MEAKIFQERYLFRKEGQLAGRFPAGYENVVD